MFRSSKESGKHVRDKILLWGPQHTGKGHPVDTGILTPGGWRRIGDLAVGDAVIGSNGEPTLVLGVYDRGELPVYRVEFSDHSSVLVDGDHLWAVQTRKRRKTSGSYKVMATREMIGRRRDKGMALFIPMVQPINFPEAELPIEPYALGCLIANGHLSGTPMMAFNRSDEDVVERVLSSGEDAVERTAHTASRVAIRSIQQPLRELGLYGLKSAEKFIPKAYLLASIDQRVALLHGLMDCDGSANRYGQGVYHTTSPRLANDFRDLVEGLGGTAPVRSQDRDGYTEFSVSVTLPHFIKPFSSLRKGGDHRFGRKPNRRIVSIDPAGSAQVRCISVAASDSLYVTERCIVTHNTHTALTWPKPIVVDRENRAAHFADRFDFQHAEPRTIEELAEAYKAIRSGAITGETVVTDSYSVIYDELVSLHTTRKDSGKFVTDFVTVNKRIAAVRDFAFSVGDFHMIFIAHAIQKYDRRGDNFSAKGLDFAGDPRFRYAFDYVFKLQPTGRDPRTSPVKFIVEKSASPNLKVGDEIVGLDFAKFMALTRGEQKRDDSNDPISADEIGTIESYAAEIGIPSSQFADATKAASGGRTVALRELTKGDGRRLYKALIRFSESQKGAA